MNKIMKQISVVVAVLLGAMALFGATVPAISAGTVLVIVNDQPITAFDIDQRIKISELLGDAPNANSRKAVLQELINDVLKRVEAERFKAMPSKKQVDDAMARVQRGIRVLEDQLDRPKL